MDTDPLEARLREIKESAATEVEARDSADRRLRRLVLDFARKMSSRPTVPFLSQGAATAGADPVLAHGWCIADICARIHFPAPPLPAEFGSLDTTQYIGLGVCVDGKVARLLLNSPNHEYMQDAYAVSDCLEDGTTCDVSCELLRPFGLGAEPGVICEQLTSALASTLHKHEEIEQYHSDGRSEPAQAMLTQVVRKGEWKAWQAAVEAELSSVESSVERAVRLLACLEPIEASQHVPQPSPRLPRPWVSVFEKLVTPLQPPGDAHMMTSPPWDHARVVEWFLGAVTVPPEDLILRRYEEGGWMRRAHWKETKTRGWVLRQGSTEPLSEPESYGWNPLTITVDGEICGLHGEELSPDVGFNAYALQQMAELAALDRLPSPPVLQTSSYTNRLGHSAIRYADGAWFSYGDFVTLGES